MASEELLSEEQYDQLSELDEIDSHSIATIVKGTKIGQGIMHLPVGISDLRDKLIESLKEYSKNVPALTRVVKSLNELFGRNEI